MLKRELKNYLWEFDEETKSLLIFDVEHEESVVLDKTRWFSLFRFMVRASARMSVKRRRLHGGETTKR